MATTLGVVASLLRLSALAQLLQHPGDAWHIGMKLFQAYNLPFQVIATLVLVASIGVVLLSKRELK